MPAVQSNKNHTRLDPSYHFFLLPVAFLNIGVAIWLSSRGAEADRPIHIWEIVLSLAFFIAVNNLRTYAKRVQDRVIRLEERTRIAELLPHETKLTNTLTLQQLIALRFASDAEIPRLALEAASEKLSAKAIKGSITNWRPDDLRV